MRVQHVSNVDGCTDRNCIWTLKKGRFYTTNVYGVQILLLLLFFTHNCHKHPLFPCSPLMWIFYQCWHLLTAEATDRIYRWRFCSKQRCLLRLKWNLQRLKSSGAFLRFVCWFKEPGVLQRNQKPAWSGWTPGWALAASRTASEVQGNLLPKITLKRWRRKFCEPELNQWG